MTRSAPPWRVPILDLQRAHEPLREELEAAFARVLTSGRFILGPEVEAFEEETAALVGAAYAVGMSSGTDALIATLMALDVGPGDEILCPSFSFFATAGSIDRLGATPIFADVSPHHFTAEREHYEALVSPRTRAIIVVHLFGRCVDMDPILELAQEHDLKVIEDAAQALGATTGGRSAGSSGAMGCFSFFPTKNLGGFGDGGLVTTDDPDLAARLRSVRTHGESSRYTHTSVGGNFRLDALQAALLRVKLPRLDDYNRARRGNARRYQRLLRGVAEKAGPGLVLPEISSGHIFHQYVVRLSGAGARDGLRQHLAAAGVQSEVYYPVALHRQPCFAALGYGTGSLPVAEMLADQVLALPIAPELDDDQLHEVADGIASFF